MTLSFHPLADLFPLMEGADFDALVASIKENGQRDPVILFEGSILDGRNRYRACQKAGIQPRFQDFMNGDPLAFVLDHNLHRRHLNEIQRAAIAAKITTMRSGERTDLPRSQKTEVSNDDAARLLNVSRTSVVAAKTILKGGTPEEIEGLKAGTTSLGPTANRIRAGLTPSEDKQQRRKTKTNAEIARSQSRQMQAIIWYQLRDGLRNLTSLPSPDEVVKLADWSNREPIINAHLQNAIDWLGRFQDAWNARAN